MAKTSRPRVKYKGTKVHIIRRKKKRQPQHRSKRFVISVERIEELIAQLLFRELKAEMRVRDDRIAKLPDYMSIGIKRRSK